MEKNGRKQSIGPGGELGAGCPPMGRATFGRVGFAGSVGVPTFVGFGSLGDPPVEFPPRLPDVLPGVLAVAGFRFSGAIAPVHPLRTRSKAEAVAMKLIALMDPPVIDRDRSIAL
jgi:hypothetical protein